jgi:hypothetical protein
MASTSDHPRIIPNPRHETYKYRDMHALLAGYPLPATYQATIANDAGPDPEGAPAMTTAPMRQAPAGGITGINGDFYEGGQFLPSTERPKHHQPAPKHTGPRREMIAPFTWEDRPEGKRSIYAALVGTDCEITPDGFMRRYAGLNPAYQRDTIWGHDIEDLIDSYNNGDRWITCDR